jgi:hypothetical protein
MRNGFDMELERKKEKLEAKNKLFNHSFHTHTHTYIHVQSLVSQRLDNLGLGKILHYKCELGKILHNLGLDCSMYTTQVTIRQMHTVDINVEG